MKGDPVRVIVCARDRVRRSLCVNSSVSSPLSIHRLGHRYSGVLAHPTSTLSPSNKMKCHHVLFITFFTSLFILTCISQTQVIEAASLPIQAPATISDSNETAIESPSFLAKMVTHMFELFNLKQVVQDIKISKTTEGTCHSCKFGIGLLQHLIQFGRGREELARLAHTICVNMNIESPRVCNGIVKVFKVSPPVVWIVCLVSFLGGVFLDTTAHARLLPLLPLPFLCCC